MSADFIFEGETTCFNRPDGRYLSRAQVLVSCPDLSAETFSRSGVSAERSGLLRLAFVWCGRLVRCASPLITVDLEAGRQPPILRERQ
jgi:hypothetical protein